MKKALLSIVILIVPIFLFGQEKKPCEIFLNDGNRISISHFGHLKCGSNISSSPESNFVMIRGTYNGQNIEIRDYSNIKKIELEDFYSKPIYGMGNAKYSGQDKGIIRVYKNNGAVFILSQATIGNSCYGGHWDGVNELRLVNINPITDIQDEIKVNTSTIKYIEF